VSAESGSVHLEGEETAEGRLRVRTGGGYMLTDELRRMVEVSNDETGEDGRHGREVDQGQLRTEATERGSDRPSGQPASAQLKLPEKRKGLPVSGGIVPEPKVANKRRKISGILRHPGSEPRARNKNSVKFRVPENEPELFDETRGKERKNGEDVEMVIEVGVDGPRMTREGREVLRRLELTERAEKGREKPEKATAAVQLMSAIWENPRERDNQRRFTAKVGSLKAARRKKKYREGAVPPLTKNGFPRFNVRVEMGGTEWMVMVDTGADYSIISEKSLTEEMRREIGEWKGEDVGSIHLPFEIRGQWKTDAMVVGGHEVGARFCVVDADLETPILGLDWQEYHQVSRDWTLNQMKGHDPTKDVPFTAEIETPGEVMLRLRQETEYAKGMFRQVIAEAPGAVAGQEWMIENTFTTAGLLAVPTQHVECVENGFLKVWMVNKDDTMITGKTGALIGRASCTYEMKEEDVRGGKKVMVKKRYEQGKYVGETVKTEGKFDRVDPGGGPRPDKLFRRHHENVARGTVGSVKSYKEMMAATLEKEEIRNLVIGGKNLAANVREGCRSFLGKWAEIFATNPLKPPTLNPDVVSLGIEVDEGARAVKEAPGRMSPEQHRIVEEHTNLMLEHGIIEEANSPWAARVVLAKKKDGKWRYCVDYRYLNSVTKKDSYPLPRIDDTLDALGNKDAKVFSSLDVASGYWHIPIKEQDREKTAFVTRNGQYQFRVVPFGLTGAPGAFCRYVDNALRDVMWKCCLVYVDDIVVWSKSVEEHKKDLETVFTRLHAAGLKLKLSKCEFFMDEITYLGFLIRDGHVGLDPAKVEAIREMTPPKTLKGLQRFLGTVNWFGRWIKDKATIAAPLTDLLRTGRIGGSYGIEIPGTIENEAFNKLKKAVTSYPVLRLPDFSKPFLVVSDASKVAIGGMLAQVWDGYEHPVAFFSKALRPEQRNWHPYEQETYACVQALRHFHHYVAYSKESIFVTDCRALAHFNTTRDIPDKVKRWLSELSQNNMPFAHRKGERNVVCDMESRDERFEEMAKEMGSGMHESPLKLQESVRGVGKIGHITAISENTSEHKGQVMVNRVAEAQKEDRFCRGVVNFWSTGKLPNSDVGQVEYLKRIHGFRASDGMIFRMPEPGERYPPRPYVPNKELREEIINSYHKDPQFAHPGAARMKARLAYDFWWPDMGAEVERYVSNCQGCSANKSHKTVRPPLQPIERMAAWKFISIDHVGPLPRTKRGYTHVMVIMDRHTRWTELVAVKGDKKGRGMTSQATLQKYRKRVENRHGQPEVVLTDGGSAFKGDFTNYLEANQVKHKVAKAYHHNTNGMAERKIRSLEESLRHYVNEGADDWDTILGEMQCSLNTLESAGPRSSPFFLNRGREHVARERRRILGAESMVVEDEEERTALQEEGAQVEEEVIRANEKADVANEKAQEKMKEAHDRRRGADPAKLVKEGDWVMVKLVDEKKGGALEPRNEGPYQVIGLDAYGNCTVQGVGRGLKKTFPMDVLSMFRGETPKRKEFPRSQFINLTALRKAARGKVVTKISRVIKSMMAVMDCTDVVDPGDMMGRRVRVTRNLKFAKGDYDGEIVDYDPNSKLFSIKYDEPDKNGVDVFDETLLTLRCPPWIMLKAKQVEVEKVVGVDTEMAPVAEGEGDEGEAPVAEGGN